MSDIDEDEKYDKLIASNIYNAQSIGATHAGGKKLDTSIFFADGHITVEPVNLGTMLAIHDPFRRDDHVLMLYVLASKNTPTIFGLDNDVRIGFFSYNINKPMVSTEKTILDTKNAIIYLKSIPRFEETITLIKDIEAFEQKSIDRTYSARVKTIEQREPVFNKKLSSVLKERLEKINPTSKVKIDGNPDYLEKIIPILEKTYPNILIISYMFQEVTTRGL